MESFNSLWQHVSNPFVRIAEVFDGKFFSQRRYLHFLVSGVAIFFIFFFGNGVKDLQLEYIPWFIKIVFSWMAAYIVNYTREWYYGKFHGAPWDNTDLDMESYGGILGASLFLILQYLL
jgi:hypothetical protein